MTATDTRPAQNSLPRVPHASWEERFYSNGFSSKPSANRTLQKITESPTTSDAESPLLGSPSASRKEDAGRYTYVSRLLGE